jgi:hypothetical protein
MMCPYTKPCLVGTLHDASALCPTLNYLPLKGEQETAFQALALRDRD